MHTLTIGKAAKQAGVSIDAVRFYEREGLLHEAQRTMSGYRLFSTGDVDRLRFIRRAKALGFSLGQIAELLELNAAKGSRASVKRLAEKRLADLELKLRELTALRDGLATLVKTCSGEGSVRGCPIVEGVLMQHGHPCTEH
ncbi:MAG TPA: heavy metal-responsive transcriptional regulator [Gammaproteobacteria bacterium]|nr:heavy metal-responsive transcriptional regulator [Gammaproteobacteria bacterium]